MKNLLLVLLLAVLATSQGCRNQLGEEVDWWVILKVPPKTGNMGFGYYDSTYKTSVFEYFSKEVDGDSTPLTKTFNQINDMGLETVAWNDEKPAGKSSSREAHSKVVMAYSFENKKGFFISHSIPSYPSFNDNKIIVTIGNSQNVYGQHLMCAQMSLAELNELAHRFMIIRPFIYQNSVKNTAYTNYLSDLGEGKTDKAPSCYLSQKFNIKPEFVLKGIFKNGFVNCSIFEDAMIADLKVNITSETWGRPQQPAWCQSGWQVNNVVKVKVGEISWGETDDHSKWALAGEKYACFGDMNRMTSQWKRGGSFFCLDNPTLVSALQKIIVQTDTCA